MTNKIALITDSSCDLPQELIDQYNVFIIPLRVSFASGDYRDHYDISPTQLYEKMETEIPKTSSPLPQDITSIFDEVVAAGYSQAVYIAISNKLSGTFNIVSSCAKNYSALKITCFDSLTLSMGLGSCVIEAAKKIATSSNIEEVITHIKNIRENMLGMYVIRTLEYLKAGGRIGKVAGTIGTILNIKPVIVIGDDGSFGTKSSARGFKKAVSQMLNEQLKKFEGKRVVISIVHGGVIAEAEALLEQAKTLLKPVESYLSQIGPAMATHTGPGLLGIITYEAKS